MELLSFEAKPVARSGSVLAANLRFLLDELQNFPADMQDILLYFHRPGQPTPLRVRSELGQEHPEFRPVAMEYRPLGQSLFFDPEAAP